MSELERIARQYQRFFITNHPNVEKVDPYGDVFIRAQKIYEDLEYKKGNEADYPRKWALSYPTFQAAVTKIMNPAEPEGQPGPSTLSKTTDTEITSQPTSPSSEAFETLESPRTSLAIEGVPDNEPGPSASQPTSPRTEESETLESPRTSSPETVIESSKSKGKEPVFIEPGGQPGSSTQLLEATDTEATSQPTSPRTEASEALESPRTSSPETVIESSKSKGKKPVFVKPGDQPGPSFHPISSQPPSQQDHPALSADDVYVFESADEDHEDCYQYGTDNDEDPVEAIPLKVRSIDGYTYIKAYDPEISWEKLTDFRVEGKTPFRGKMIISAPSRNTVKKYAELRREYVVNCADLGYKWSEFDPIPRGNLQKLHLNRNDIEIMAVATDVNQSKTNPQRFPLTYAKILFKDKSVYYYPKGELSDLAFDIERRFNTVRLRVGQTIPVKPKNIGQREELQDVGSYALEVEGVSTPEDFFVRRRGLRQAGQDTQWAPGNRRTPGNRQTPGNQRTPGSQQTPVDQRAPPLTEQAGEHEKTEKTEKTVYGDMPQNWLIARNNNNNAMKKTKGECSAQNCENRKMRGKAGDTQLECGHHFHAGCIDLSKTVNNAFSCPKCEKRHSFFYTFYNTRYTRILIDCRSFQKFGYPKQTGPAVKKDPFKHALNSECPICMQTMSNMNTTCTAVTSCGSVPHIFHTWCLSQGGPNCGVCRQTMTKVYTNGRTFTHNEWERDGNNGITFNPWGFIPTEPLEVVEEDE